MSCTVREEWNRNVLRGTMRLKLLSIKGAFFKNKSKIMVINKDNTPSPLTRFCINFEDSDF